MPDRFVSLLRLGRSHYINVIGYRDVSLASVVKSSPLPVQFFGHLVVKVKVKVNVYLYSASS